MTPASLTFHLSHVDHAVLQETIERTRSPKFRELIASLRSTGEWPFPYDIFISVKGLADDEAMINTIRLVGVDGLDADSRTRAYVDGRREALQLLDIFRRHFPGFAQARIKSIAPMLGVRETRRIAGAFTLGVADLAAARGVPFAPPRLAVGVRHHGRAGARAVGRVAARVPFAREPSASHGGGTRRDHGGTGKSAFGV